MRSRQLGGGVKKAHRLDCRIEDEGTEEREPRRGDKYLYSAGVWPCLQKLKREPGLDCSVFSSF